MITLVFTYRNRNLNTVENCFESLKNQTNFDYKVVLINYGSTTDYSLELEKLLLNFPSVSYINCPVSKQLWNKSRAINIALKNCETPNFFVGDVDMIFKKNFIEKLHQLKSNTQITYFQVGFLDQKESLRKCDFNDYKINFLSTPEATGMTLYPTDILKKINGYDEFYHGWGAEDTDVHFRLKNLGNQVSFHNDELFILHQWHPKAYRTKNSLEPFHSTLEKINHQYIKQLQITKQSVANKNFDYGVLPNLQEYQKLDLANHFIKISNEINQIDAFFSGTIFNFKNEILALKINEYKNKNSSFQKLKNTIKSKKQQYYTLNEINDKLLLLIITHFRNQPYQLEFSQLNKEISLKIAL